MLFALLTFAVLVKAKLTVHIVPHTHDDVGWLKTVDEYYSGSNNSIQHAAVRNILDSVIRSLEINPERKFTYVEMAFFDRWWRELDTTRKDVVRRLVASGQFQFVNGGWCMHDEAATHYVDMVDQTTLGHRILLEEFGVVPSVGWQIDPFGHSTTQAALLSADVGFDSLFFGRIDYQDRDVRRKEKRAEFIWRASPSLGPDAQVFSGLTGEYGGNYGPPTGFNWHNDAEPVEDDERLSTYNLASRVGDFIARATEQANMTRGEHIMWTMGSDFNYDRAETWFINLDRLIKAVNEDGRMVARYSTPIEYVSAKRLEDIEWPIKTSQEGDDFFPYADGPHQFWTGYFTSRPALKDQVRQMSARHNAIRQVQAFAGYKNFSAVGAVTQLLQLEEALSVAQHHDAVSGTAKQHVAFDYAKRLADGGAAADEVFWAGLSTIAGAGRWRSCPRLNETVCEETQRGTTTMSVWNQLGQSRNERIYFPVVSRDVQVSLASGSNLAVQVYEAPETINNYERSTKEASLVASFVAPLLPVSLTTFTVTQGETTSLVLHASEPLNDDVVLENEFLSLVFSRESGRLASMKNKDSGIEIAVEQYFCYYVGGTGDEKSGQKSGAYIFRPKTGECLPIALGDATKTISTVVQGAVQEVRQTFALDPDSDLPWLTQKVRLAAGDRFASFEFDVGAIPTRQLAGANATAETCVMWRGTVKGVRVPQDDKNCSEVISSSNAGFCECADGRRAGKTQGGKLPFTCTSVCRFHTGKEVVSRFNTSIASAGELLTDSNGRDMLLRRQDMRPSWTLNQTEPVAGNYYPINSAVAIGDPSAQLTVLVDRAQGAGSVASGVLELMVHRRLLVDDARGVGEPLNETKFTQSYALQDGGAHFGPGLVIRGTHYLTLERPAEAAMVWRPLADRIFSRPLLAFGGPAVAETFTALANPLPPNVQLMTLHALSEGRLLLRLSHQFGIGEDAVLSEPVTIDLAALFDPAVLPVITVREVSLTNNQDKSEILARRARNAKWTGDTSPHTWRHLVFDYGTSTKVTLGPLEIKTFELTTGMSTSDVFA